MITWFEHISAYDNDDVPQAIQDLIQDAEFLNIISSLPENLQSIRNKLPHIRTILEFQREIIYPFADWIVKTTIEELTYSGLENLSPEVSYLFISNHRDIVMDPLLINYILHKASFPTTQIGIGNNLLIKPWIEKLVRLNKSFVVHRNLKGKKLLIELHRLSNYIRYVLLEKKESVWIAQREGRAKNGIDETQISLLKMLNLAFKKNPGHYAIVPVAFSYEFDPCDALKAKELYLKCHVKSFAKKTYDDLLHMKLGLLENKGKVHVHFDKMIRTEFPLTTSNFDILKNKIDTAIQKNFKLFDTHIYAFKRLYDSRFEENPEIYSRAINYFKQQKQVYGLNEVIEKILLQMYANPLLKKKKEP